ncbi:uncharacterized protein CPUR_01324 [Claviceps purpurea 20.1]|uniref:Reverse transcriptase Ty1/copia-type domain-containing protein n=1 Tax=Claviceps purpurea (strain 20.1) TaxID=1111077 RepID=M1W2Q8_CLAP2|nr:uncharacterized protein CPUR_01324 [Claviceps purpurea 20.1]
MTSDAHRFAKNGWFFGEISNDTYPRKTPMRQLHQIDRSACLWPSQQKYNLELKQYDVTNALVPASMDRDVYMRMPKGYRKKGTIVKLQKALYGLRISFLLWQKEFTTNLKASGFQTVDQGRHH